MLGVVCGVREQRKASCIPYNIMLSEEGVLVAGWLC